MTATLRRGLVTDNVGLLPLSDRPVARVSPDDTIHHAVESMRNQGTGCAMVLKDSQLSVPPNRAVSRHPPPTEGASNCASIPNGVARKSETEALVLSPSEHW